VIRFVHVSLDTDIPERLAIMAAAVRRTPLACIRPWLGLSLATVAHRFQTIPYRDPSPYVEEIPIDGCDVLAGRAGDCKAKSIALAAIAAAQGHRWRFQYFFQAGAPLGHVRIDAFVRRRWVAFEPTLNGAPTMRACLSCSTVAGDAQTPTPAP
jgi:transglutaminase-like putative cysteine protease